MDEIEKNLQKVKSNPNILAGGCDIHLGSGEVTLSDGTESCYGCYLEQFNYCPLCGYKWDDPRECKRGKIEDIDRRKTMEAKEPCIDCPNKVVDDWGYFCDLSCGKRIAWLNFKMGYNQALIDTITEKTDQIPALIKKAGYVKLADNQDLPKLPLTYFAEIAARNYGNVMLSAGWRKVILREDNEK